MVIGSYFGLQSLMVIREGSDISRAAICFESIWLLTSFNIDHERGTLCFHLTIVDAIPSLIFYLGKL